MGGSEPADAIRAVNALLTRLDQLKAAPNVMVGAQPPCLWVQPHVGSQTGDVGAGQRLDQLKAAPRVVVGASGQMRRPAHGEGGGWGQLSSSEGGLQASVAGGGAGSRALSPQPSPPLFCTQVLTTSNITEAIDLAFVDRADIKAYIGNPSLQARRVAGGGGRAADGSPNPGGAAPASPPQGRRHPAALTSSRQHSAPTLHSPCRYEILRTCMAELAGAGIIADASPAPLLPFPAACAADEPEAGGAAGGGGDDGAGASGGCGMDEDTGALQARYLRCARLVVGSGWLV